MEKDPFYFRQMEVGPMQNFAYLIGDCDTRECVAVDPAWQTDLILEQAKKDEMKITGILVTHTHYDHVNGVESLLQATDAKVYVNKEESAFLKSSRADSTGIFINISAPNLTPVSGGDKIKVGKVGVEFIHTPGHTPGSQCFLVDNRIVSGDTLFIGSCGRIDLPGSNPEQMYYSLTQKLMALPDETILFPGHNYSDRPTSTIGEEKQSNPYFHFHSLKQFLAAMGYR